MLALSVLRERKLRAAPSTSSETASSVSGSGCPVNLQKSQTVAYSPQYIAGNSCGEDEGGGRSGIVIDNVYRLA